VIFVAVLVLLTGDAIGIVRIDSDPAGALLARARAFVAAHPTARFHGSVTVDVRDPRSPLGEAQTLLAQLTGEVQPRRTHAVLTDDAGATELLMVKGATYVRAADTAAGLGAAVYARADGKPARLMRVRVEQAKGFDIAAVLAATTDARKLNRRGDTTIIESDVDASMLFGRAIGARVVWVTLHAVVADDGELRGAQVVTRSEATITDRLQFTEWGVRADAITAPPASQVDATPAIAAAKLAAFKTAPLLMPGALPAGWELVRADVLSAADTQEGCAQAELAYEDQRRVDAGFLSLYELPRSCAKRPGGETTPFVAGKYNGFAARTAGVLYVQITEGETVVQTISDMAPAKLAQTLSGLVPLALQSS
jgi:hypothetical protein